MDSMVAYGGRSILFTVTAPGRDRLPYDDSLGLNEGKRQVARRPGREWNITCGKRESKLYRKAAQATERRCGRRPMLLSKSFAFQKRGVLHGHLVLGAETPSELNAAHVFMDEYEKRAAAHGFGDVDRAGWVIEGKRRETLPANRAAGYISKYVTKDGATGPEVLETAIHPEAPARIMYVKAGLSPWTMQALRRVRFAYMLILRSLGGGWVVRDLAQTPGEVEEIIEWITRHMHPPPTDGAATDGTDARERARDARRFAARFVPGIRTAYIAAV